MRTFCTYGLFGLCFRFAGILGRFSSSFLLCAASYTNIIFSHERLHTFFFSSRIHIKHTHGYILLQQDQQASPGSRLVAVMVLHFYAYGAVLFVCRSACGKDVIRIHCASFFCFVYESWEKYIQVTDCKACMCTPSTPIFLFYRICMVQ